MVVRNRSDHCRAVVIACVWQRTAMAQYRPPSMSSSDVVISALCAQMARGISGWNAIAMGWLPWSFVSGIPIFRCRRSTLPARPLCTCLSAPVVRARRLGRSDRAVPSVTGDLDHDVAHPGLRTACRQLNTNA